MNKVTRDELHAMRDRIIARFDDKTASNSAAVHGPLVEAILEELLHVEEPAAPADQAVQS